MITPYFKTLVRNSLLFSFLAFQLSMPGAFEISRETPKGAVILTVNGKIGIKNTPEAAVFDTAMLEALPQHSFVTATPWFKVPVRFTGPLLKDVLQAVKATGTNVKAIALNDYKINIPLEDALKYDLLLARQIDGRVLSVREKGPLFVIYPFDRHPELRNLTYYSRSIWQLKALSIE
ncbi:MAG: molybdopterin-dependent oxidoreductase [Burkholderiaceae bacterium]